MKGDIKMKKYGTMFYNTNTDRFDIIFKDGTSHDLHCGDCFDVYIGGIYYPTRIEMSNRWYLVGIKGTKLEGLKVKM